MLPLEEIKPSGSKSNMGMNGDKLEVTIIPVDEEAYSKTIMMPNSAMIGKWNFDLKCHVHNIFLVRLLKQFGQHIVVRIYEHPKHQYSA